MNDAKFVIQNRIERVGDGHHFIEREYREAFGCANDQIVRVTMVEMS